MKKMKRYFSGVLLFILLCILSVCAYAYNDNDLVINADSTYNGITVDGDLYVIKDRILTLTGKYHGKKKPVHPAGSNYDRVTENDGR